MFRKFNKSLYDTFTGRRLKSNSIKNNEPPILSAAEGDKCGEIHLIWDHCRNAFSYLLQKSSSQKKPFIWKYEDVVNNNNYTVSNLKSNKKYSFRIAAITSTGKKLWSLPVIKKAP